MGRNQQAILIKVIICSSKTHIPISFPGGLENYVQASTLALVALKIAKTHKSSGTHRKCRCLRGDGD